MVWIENFLSLLDLFGVLSFSQLDQVLHIFGLIRFFMSVEFRLVKPETSSGFIHKNSKNQMVDFGLFFNPRLCSPLEHAGVQGPVICYFP